MNKYASFVLYFEENKINIVQSGKLLISDDILDKIGFNLDYSEDKEYLFKYFKAAVEVDFVTTVYNFDRTNYTILE